MVRKGMKKEFSCGETMQIRQNTEWVHEKVREKAYDLYIKRGRVAGNDLADWFEAERLVKGEINK